MIKFMQRIDGPLGDLRDDPICRWAWRITLVAMLVTVVAPAAE